MSHVSSTDVNIVSVFKYASKGFGIRILPSYMAVLPGYKTEKAVTAIARGERLFADISKLDKIGWWTL